MKLIHLSFAYLLFSFSLTAQHLPPAGGDHYIQGPSETCLSPEQRQDIQTRLRRNINQLQQEGVLPQDQSAQTTAVSFGWPLRKKSELPYFSYYSVNNFVDHNNNSGLLDYNCFGRTYDGHKGLDIGTFPFPWYVYENDFVEVIAAEGGTVILKDDGNEDDHCSWIGNWNAVYVRHDDGSVAWYGHLKKNSTTEKNVGERVDKYEYLGVLASSGRSTGPHLHLEIYDEDNNLVDPFVGECNDLNQESWWGTQPPYRRPILNALLTHDAEPVFGCPTINEVPHFSNNFAPGDRIYTALYFQDPLANDQTIIRLLQPDQTAWQTWGHVSPNTFTWSWWWWYWDLPADGPFGTWQLEATYQGRTYLHEFEYGELPVGLGTISASEIQIFPNPSDGRFKIAGVEEGKMKVMDCRGKLLLESSGAAGEIDLSGHAAGVYFVLIEMDGKSSVQRLVKR